MTVRTFLASARVSELQAEKEGIEAGIDKTFSFDSSPDEMTAVRRLKVASVIVLLSPEPNPMQPL